MSNDHVIERLKAIQASLLAIHDGSIQMSSASKGEERAAFVDLLLTQILPTPFRFGTGDATDHTGKRTGQLDIVVEHPFAPSLPLLRGDVRLYPAESIAAVIEVKSNAQRQWKEAIWTAENVRGLIPRLQFSEAFNRRIRHIPVFVVGYEGWKSVKAAQAKLEGSFVDGILCIRSGVFVTTPQVGSWEAEGLGGLWSFLACLHQLISATRFATADLLKYVCDDTAE